MIKVGSTWKYYGTWLVKEVTKANVTARRIGDKDDRTFKVWKFLDLMEEMELTDV